MVPGYPIAARAGSNMSSTERESALRPHSTLWFVLTPDHFVTALLVAEGLLLLSRWFNLLPKGYAVMVALATVLAAISVLLLWFADSLLFRRHFQFFIRSLLLLTAAIAIICSWLNV